MDSGAFWKKRGAISYGIRMPQEGTYGVLCLLSPTNMSEVLELTEQPPVFHKYKLVVTH